jgi:hypothetical protein
MNEVASVLARLREQRARVAAELAGLDGAIAALEEASREAVPALPAGAPAVPPAIAPAPEQPAGPYRYLGFYEAAAAYLKEAGQPKTAREIADGLLAGGYFTIARHFRGSVRTMLRRWQPTHDSGIRETDEGGRWFVDG